MLTIAVIVPNDYFAPWGFVQSILKLPPKYYFKSYQGCVVDINRNYIWHEMLLEKDKKSDLLWVDSDIVFEPEDVATIENDLEKYDLVTGLYMLKSWDWKPAIFKKVGNDYEFTEMQEGIFEIEGCGNAFLGISKRVIADERLDKKPFSKITEEDITHGEDISFIQRARALGYKLYCDSSIRVGHLKTETIRIGDKQPDIY
jgi:hypothetical protein